MLVLTVTTLNFAKTILFVLVSIWIKLLVKLPLGFLALCYYISFWTTDNDTTEDEQI